MQPIDEFSFVVGVMDCFNEMVHAGVKRIAFGVPVSTREEREIHAEAAEEICAKYSTKFYREDEGFLTDLFPCSANRDTYLLIFYQSDADLAEYLALKARKKELVSSGQYTGAARYQIAFDLGKLLSYPETVIQEKIAQNPDKEVL